MLFDIGSQLRFSFKILIFNFKSPSLTPCPLVFYGMGFAHIYSHKSCVFMGLSFLAYHTKFSLRLFVRQENRTDST